MDAPVAGPGGAGLSWANQDGASYTVSRADVGVLTKTPIVKTNPYSNVIAFFDSSPLFYTNTYQYTITANFAQGCGSSQVSVVPSKPYTPIPHELYSPTYAESLTTPWPLDGRSLVYFDLAWEAPRGYRPPGGDNQGFVVFGPGMGSDGRFVSGCGGNCEFSVPFSTTAPGVLGEQTWIIVPAWDTRNGRFLDVSTGLRISVKFAGP
jgi:hypothetical protein